MTDTNFDQWLELKRPQEHVSLSEHYSELQSQQMYEFAYFLVQNLEDSDNNDQELCPPTPPPSAPSSQAEATTGAGPGSSQGADEERREADRRSLARLLDMERFKEEQARRARAAAVKKAALPRPRPLPIPIRQPSQNRSPVKQEYESQGVTAPLGQRLPPLRVSREPRTPSRRQMTPPVEYPMRQGRIQLTSTPPQDISPPRQQNGSGGALFDAIYETISKRLEEKINSHVEEFASEMQSLRNQMKRERALMEDFLKEKFGLKDDDCAKFWDGLNRQLRNNDGQSLAVRPNQPPTAGNSTRAASVIPSVEDSIRIKRERLEEESRDEIVEENSDEGEDERGNQNMDQALDRVLDEVLVEHQDEDEVSGEGMDKIKLEVEDEDEDQQQEAENEETDGEDEEDEEEQEADVEVEAAEDDDEAEEAEEEDSPEPDDSDDPDYYDPYDIEKTPVPIEVLLGVRRAPSGVKRKAQEMEDGEEEPQPPVSLKKPAWVQVVSPVPNPHLRQQAKQLQTVRKWYKEGGSRNPVVLE